MPDKDTVTMITAIVSICLSSAAFAVSLLNYLRDRVKVTVSLQWDMEVTGNQHIYDHRKKWGTIRVANIGRRPVFITMVALQFPRKGLLFWKSPAKFGVFFESVAGTKLLEGDAPFMQVASQDELSKYAEDWRDVIAIAYDSTGREYTSKRVKKKPSWAEPSTDKPEDDKVEE